MPLLPADFILSQSLQTNLRITLDSTHTQPEGTVHRSDTTGATRDCQTSNGCTLSDSQ